MGFHLQIGMLLMMAAVVMQAGLTFRLQMRNVYREHPAFFIYSIFILLGNALCFVVLYTRFFSDAQYARIYWLQTAVDAGFGLAVIAELFHCRTAGIIVGMATVLLLLPTQPIQHYQWVELALAGLSIVAAVFKDESRIIASGLVVYYVFPAILYLPSVPAWAIYVPVIAWIVAIIVWFQE